MPSVSVVIIGDEILSGKFADENGPYLIRRLRELGARLERIEVISDELDHIADVVRRASARSDLVITTGGVGPTHDDRTLEGIGRAFDLPLVADLELVELLERWGMDPTGPALRMATLPRGTELLWDAALHYPVVMVRNVYVFPGVPKLMRNKFEVVAARFAGPRVITARVYVDDHETAITERLDAVVAAFPDVSIGSYPRFGEGPYKVILTLEGYDQALVEAARRALIAVMPTVEITAGTDEPS